MYKTKIIELAHDKFYDQEYFIYLACGMFFANIEAYCEYFIHNLQEAEVTDINIPMPAERFLEIYRYNDELTVTDDSQDRSIKYRMKKGLVLKEFRDYLHK